MRHLILANTPAHVHLYRNAVRELLDRGHEVLVLGREDSHTPALLSYYDLPHEMYGGRSTSKSSLVLALPGQFYRIHRRARSYGPDVVWGRGAYAAYAGSVSKARTILVMDSVPWRMGYLVPSWLADSVVTTNAFREDLGPHHHRFHGLTECAYLHPDVYEPDPSVRAELGLSPEEPFAVLRFNGFGAFHDVGVRGFTADQQRELIERLAERMAVFVSDEAEAVDVDALPARRYDIHPARIHHALAEASLLVADTGTMTTEAALLGTPAVRANPSGSRVNLGEFHELERAGLVKNRPPPAVIPEATALADDDGAQRRWERRSREFLRDRVNLTDLIVDVAEHPDQVGRVVGRYDDTEPVAVTP